MSRTDCKSCLSSTLSNYAQFMTSVNAAQHSFIFVMGSIICPCHCYNFEFHSSPNFLKIMRTSNSIRIICNKCSHPDVCCNGCRQYLSPKWNCNYMCIDDHSTFGNRLEEINPSQVSVVVKVKELETFVEVRIWTYFR